jgi:hypothetical protein
MWMPFRQFLFSSPETKPILPHVLVAGLSAFYKKRLTTSQAISLNSSLTRGPTKTSGYQKPYCSGIPA